MTFKPPDSDLSREISPPCDLAISLDIVIPNPHPTIDLFLDLSSVKKGLKTSL